MSIRVLGGHLKIWLGKFLILLGVLLVCGLNLQAAPKRIAKWATQSMFLSSHELAFVGINLRLITDLDLSAEDQSALLDLIQRIQAKMVEVPIYGKASGAYQQTVKVATFEAFLDKTYKAEFWNETSLDDLPIAELIKMAHPVKYVSDNAQVQRQIQNHAEARAEIMKERMSKLLERSVQFAQKINEQIKDQGGDAKPVPQRTSAYLRTVLEERFNEAFASDELILLKKLLISYFRNLPKDRLAEIAFEISKLPLLAEPLDVASAAILNSGPHLQKLLQLLARNPALPKALRDIFERLENGSKPAPWKKVAQALDEQKIQRSAFTYIEQKPLGVGSMAQAHRAQYMTRDQKKKSAVIRLLKPGIFRLVEIDEKVLVAVAQDLDRDLELKRFNLPALSPLIEDISLSIAEELNVAQTVRNQNDGGRVYAKETILAFNQQKNFVVVGAPSTFAPIGSSTVMIQDLVIGNKPAKEFDRLQSIYPSLYRKVSEKLTEIWVEEAFFGSGFFHADLHQGNLMVLYTDNAISVQILDYGMVGRLNSSLQNSILLFTVGVLTGNAKLIASTLSNLSKTPLSETEYRALLAKVTKRVQGLGASNQFTMMNNSIEGWTAWALSESIEFNYEFLKLNRALQAIKSLLIDSGSPSTVQDIAKEVTLRYKARFSKMILLEPHLGAKDYSLLLKELFPQKMEIKETSKAITQPVRCEMLF